MNAIANASNNPLADAFMEEEAMTVSEFVAKVRQLPEEDFKDLCEVLAAARVSDEEAEAAVGYIEEAFSSRVGRLIQTTQPVTGGGQ